MTIAILALGLGPLIVIALASLCITIALACEHEGSATAAALIKWYFYLLNLRDRGERSAPRIEKHKTRVLGWMTYWPWSALWTLLHDPVKRIWRMIYAHTARAFQSISNRVFATVDESPTP